MKKLTYLSPLLASLLLVACNSGTSASNHDNPQFTSNSAGTLDQAIKNLHEIPSKNLTAGDSYPNTNYQSTLMIPESIQLVSYNYVYFSDDSCGQKVSAVFFMNTGGKVMTLPAMTTSTAGQGLFASCGAFNWNGYIGCSGQWEAGATGLIKSTRFEYTYKLNGQNMTNYGTCKYNSEIGTELPANYTYAYGPSEFCSGSTCGFSQQYAPDIIQTATAWVLGSKTANAAGVYGTKGIASRNNMPGSRALGATFYDESGNIYLYGGLGLDSTGATGRLGDLWKYAPKENTWTWVDGQNVVATSGSESGITTPGAFSEMQYWTVPNGSSNDFYIYGGFGYTAEQGLRDTGAFWKYNTQTKTWVKLLSGRMNESASQPGGRRGGSTVRINNKLYMFGGYGFTTDANLKEGVTNEMWEYDTSTQKWTRLGGSYDLKPVPTATWPSGRYRAAMWRGNDGMIYMFGGTGIDYRSGTSTFGDTLNDFWQYNPQTNTWKLLNDGSTSGPYGNYGTRLYGSTDNYPAYRAGATTWTDAQGNLWLYGGAHIWSDGSKTAYFNDLWKYQPTTKKWTWVAGDKITSSTLDQARYGVYGTRNLATNNNMPGARYGAMSMTDGYSLWVIGGNGYDETNAGYLNGIWKMTPVATY